MKCVNRTVLSMVGIALACLRGELSAADETWLGETVMVDSRVPSQRRILPAGNVTSLTFGESGKLLLSASADGAVRIWDVLEAREQKVLHVSGRCTKAEFAGGGQWIVAGAPNTIVVWRATDTEIDLSINHAGGGTWTCSAAQSLLARCTKANGSGGI